MMEANEYFATKYNYDIFKNNSINQLLSQAEIDAIGISSAGQNELYLIDVAFHSLGLSFGDRQQTTETIIKKYLRAAFCAYSYFNIENVTLIFASPKIHDKTLINLKEAVKEIQYIINKNGLNYKVKLFANSDFSDLILNPILDVCDEVADTSELFIRSIKMYNLFNKATKTKLEHSSGKTFGIKNEDTLKSDYSEMKIGAIARTVLTNLLEDGKVSKDEIQLMQTSDYSKKIFDIQYPLLTKAKLYTSRPNRYYSKPIKIYNEFYYLCSEWFEVDANNDRPFLLKWINAHK